MGRAAIEKQRHNSVQQGISGARREAEKRVWAHAEGGFFCCFSAKTTAEKFWNSELNPSCLIQKDLELC